MAAECIRAGGSYVVLRGLSKVAITRFNCALGSLYKLFLAISTARRLFYCAKISLAAKKLPGLIFLLHFLVCAQAARSESLKDISSALAPQPKFEFRNFQPTYRNIVVTQSGRVLAVGDSSPLMIGEAYGTTWKTHWIAHNRNFTDIALSGDKKTVWLTASTGSNSPGELYFSRDEGETWTLFTAKLTFVPYSVATTGDGNQVWVGGSGGKVVHAQINDASFQTVMDLGGSEFVTVLRVLDANGQLLAAGSNGLIAILRSPNTTVERPTCGLGSSFMSFAQDPRSGRMWLGGTDGAVCTSKDKGARWRGSHIPFNGQSIYALAYEAKTDRLFATGIGSWIEVQNVASGQWVDQVSSEVNATIHYFTIDEKSNSIWAAGANAAIFRKPIGDDTWAAVTPPEAQTPLQAIASSSDGRHVFAVGDQGSLRVSLDAGETWRYSTADVDAFWGVATDEQGKVAYAVGSAGALYRWEESTGQWQHQAFTVTSEEMHAIWLSKDGAKILLADLTGKMFRSTDHGKTWSPIVSVPQGRSIYRIASSADEKMLGAVGSNGMVLISRDTGGTWQEYKGPEASSLSSLAFSKGRIWTAAGNRRFSYSDDGAKTWTTYNAPYDAGSIVGLAYAADSLWVISSDIAIFSGDNGNSYSHISPDHASYPFIAVSASASGEAWIATEGGEVLSATKTGAVYPVLKKYSLPNVLFSGTNSGVLFFSKESTCMAKELDVVASLATTDGKLLRQLTSELAWQDAATANLSFTVPVNLPTSDLILNLLISCGSEYTRMYSFPGMSLKPWYEKFPGGLNGLAACALAMILPFMIFLLYLIKPAWLLSLSRVLDTISLPVPFNLIVRFFQKYLLVDLLIKKPRVLDAWIEEVIPIFERRWCALNFTKNNEVYFPLKINFYDTSGAAHSSLGARPRELGGLMSQWPMAVQILGVGGVGKTTLAAAFARWLLNGEMLAHRALPLVFDGKITDLKEAVSSSLKLMLDELAPDSEFTAALLRQKRLVPIFDRFSEQAEDTKNEMRSAFIRLPSLQLCIFTSRTYIDVDANVCRITPLPIGSATSLTSYMEQEITRLDKLAVYASVSDRASLVAELARTLEADTEQVITPLLASMFVDLVLKSKAAPGDLKQAVPETTTELYLKYFYLTVTSKGSTPFRYDTIVDVGARLAELAVLGNYAPAPFRFSEGVKAIEPVVGTQAEVLINAIVVSGLLDHDESLGNIVLKFTIDMLAQTLASYRLLTLKGLSDEWWGEFQLQMPMDSEVSGEFLRIISMVRTALRRSESFDVTRK